MAIKQGDFALISREKEFTVYKIALINNSLIFIFNHTDDVVLLERDELNYLYNGDKVFFMKSQLQEFVNEFFQTLNLKDSEIDKFGEIAKLDTFWASRFFNNFKNVKNIFAIMRTKPIEMTWATFYKSMLVNCENTLYSDTITQKNSIFLVLWSWIGY